MSTPQEIVEANLAQPAKASSDGMSVEQHKITDQLKVSKDLDANDAMSQPHRGLRFNRLVGHGPTG